MKVMKEEDVVWMDFMVVEFLLVKDLGIDFEILFCV